MSKGKRESGQILLIVVLVSSVLLTIGLSISQISTNETKIAKLEEESKKAFKAAEAGIEQSIKDDVVAGKQIQITGGTTENLNVGVTVNVSKTTNLSANSFQTPLIKKDEQYTFYLSDYPSLSNEYNGDSLTFYFESNKSTSCSTDSTSKSALEFTLIYGSTPTVKKYVAEPCGTSRVGGTPNLTTVDSEDGNFKHKVTISGLSSLTNKKILIVRTVFSDTKIKIVGSANLKDQGKYITSEATTKDTNVTKKVQLFQSYPQIPADFFVTSF